MCGIAGIISPTRRVISGRVLQSILQRLAHRGPDGAGWLVGDEHQVITHTTLERETIGQVWLLHTRLSILDISEAGRQPMSTRDGRYHITFNGEIYNFKELRSELEQVGYSFETGTDTEVLLQAYAHWGPAMLPRLIGMFGFAIYDLKNKKVFLARDFAGIKPLYYSSWQGCLAFASEIKAFFNLPGFQPYLNAEALYDYLRFGVSDYKAQTLFGGVYQLLPGTSAELSLEDPTHLDTNVYWDLTQNPQSDLSFEQAAEQLREIFLNSVRLHLRSDVPVGATLSGGIDSSSIVCAMRKLEPGVNFRTYSYIADDGAISEEKWIDTINANGNSRQARKIHCSSESLLNDMGSLIAAQDLPFGSTSIYAQFKVFERAKEDGIKVLLDGQGADEILAGYPVYLMVQLASLIRSGKMGKAVQLATNLRRRKDANKLWLHLGRYLPPQNMQPALWKLFNVGLMPEWLNSQWFRERGVTGRDPRISAKRRLKEELANDLRVDVIPRLLRYADRNSMAHSVENRVPFLTSELVQFVLSLPERYLISQDGTTKSVFRAAMRGIVPDAILNRKEKIGFDTPEKAWFINDLNPLMEKLISNNSLDDMPMLNIGKIKNELKAMTNGNKNFHLRTWRWLNFIIWKQTFEVQSM
jgi:asparagine synthase (glutamine-hydrolysing)